MSLNSAAAGRMLDAQREPGQYGPTDPSVSLSPRITPGKHWLEALETLGLLSWADVRIALLVSSTNWRTTIDFLAGTLTYLGPDRWEKARSWRSKKSQSNFIVLIQFIQYLLRACYVPSTVLDTLDRMLCLWKGAEATCLGASGESVSWSSGRVRSTVFRWRICLRRFLRGYGSLGKASPSLLAFTGAKRGSFLPQSRKKQIQIISM